jgi:hypothetical protein
MSYIFQFAQLLPRGKTGSFQASPALVKGVAWAFASLVVGWVLASWFWDVVRPDVPPVAEASPLQDHISAATTIASRHLFGRESSEGDGPDAGKPAVNWRLSGAMTASPGVVGFAILSEDGKPPIAAVEGETIAPGVTLLEVLTGRVSLKIGEKVETLEMTTTIPQSLPAAERSPGAVGAPTGVPPSMAARSATRLRPERSRP